VKRSDWHEAAFEPLFGTIEDWINDHLGAMGADEEAVYAVEETRSRDGGRGVHIVMATDVGLFDFWWLRPETAEERSLTGTLVPYRLMRGFSISGETRLAPTLMHQPPVWHLRAEVPAIDIAAPEHEAAFLELCTVIVKALAK